MQKYQNQKKLQNVIKIAIVAQTVAHLVICAYFSTAMWNYATAERVLKQFRSFSDFLHRQPENNIWVRLIFLFFFAQVIRLWAWMCSKGKK